MIESVHQSGDPSDSAFRQADLQVGILDGIHRIQPVDCGMHGIGEEQNANDIGGCIVARRRRLTRRPDVQIDDRAGLGAGRDEGFPMPGVNRRQAEFVGGLREGDRLEAALGVPTNQVGRNVRIGQPRNLTRNHAPGMPPGPFVEMPIVPGIDRRPSKFRVDAELEALTGEPRQERREVDRRKDAVEVHIGDARIDVPGPAAHLGKARRLERVLLDRTADHSVETDVRNLASVVHPDFLAILLDDVRNTIAELRRHPAFERMGRLHDVVVSRNDQVATFGSIGFGKEGDLLGLARRGLCEGQIGLQIFKTLHDCSLRQNFGLVADELTNQSTPVHVGSPLEKRRLHSSDEMGIEALEFDSDLHQVDGGPRDSLEGSGQVGGSFDRVGDDDDPMTLQDHDVGRTDSSGQIFSQVGSVDFTGVLVDEGYVAGVHRRGLMNDLWQFAHTGQKTRVVGMVVHDHSRVGSHAV